MFYLHLVPSPNAIAKANMCFFWVPVPRWYRILAYFGKMLNWYNRSKYWVVLLTPPHDWTGVAALA